MNGRTYDVEVEDLGTEPSPVAMAAAPAAATTAAAAEPAAPPTVTGGAPGEVRAPMPGVVSEVRVRVGQPIAAGDVLLILEAMKMDNEIPAPSGGTVREIRVARGEQVSAQQLLVVLG